MIRLPTLISSCLSSKYYTHPHRAVCVALRIYTRHRNSGWHYCFTFRRSGIRVSACRLEILTGCRDFPQLPQTNVPRIRPRVVPSTSVPVHHPLIILPYDCTVCSATSVLNPLNAELNPICHLLALLGAHHIFHVSGLRVKHTVN